MRYAIAIGMLTLASCMPAPEPPKVSIELGFAEGSGAGVTITPGGLTIERTGVRCKTGSDNVGHSCSNTSHTCADLADDMVKCCGKKENVSTASCTDKTGGESSSGNDKK